MTTTMTTGPRYEADYALRQALAGWLDARGLDTTSPALADTPDRVLRAWTEMTTGYSQDPAQILARTFDVDHAGTPILVTGVPFSSLCEHHLLPFAGTADIAYQPAPGAPVAGLSKLPRLLDVYARRLQTQERLTRQVADALHTHLAPLGAACVIRSEHGCLAHRGARKPGTVMTTTAYTGRFLADPHARAELHTLMTT